MGRGWKYGLMPAIIGFWAGFAQAQSIVPIEDYLSSQADMDCVSYSPASIAPTAECDFSCGMGCDSACDGMANRGGRLAKLTSLIRPSDRCFDDFISPMIDFVHFEDPRNLTELRPIFVHHNIPNALGPGAVPAGGSVQLFAAQFRIALTDRLSLIAVKDGYILDSTEGDLDTLLHSGWADIAGGLKYNLVRNVESGSLLSGGFTYEIPLGTQGSFQAVGNGQFHFFATGGQRLLDGNAHVLSSFGWQLPVDQGAQTTFVHWNNHFDLRLTNQLYVFTECSWRSWTDSADAGLPLGVGGQDLLNLPVTNIAGTDLLTQNVGVKLKPRSNVEWGVAYEFPVTSFKDIIEDRWQFEAIVRY